MPMGVWVISTRNSALRFRLAWECVRSSAPPATHRRGKMRTAPRRGSARSAPPTRRRQRSRPGGTASRCWRTSGWVCSPRTPRGQAARPRGRCGRRGMRPAPGRGAASAGPILPSACRREWRQSHGQHERARRVVVVLRPRPVGIRAGGEAVVHRELLDRRRRPAGHLRREHLRHFDQARPSATTSTAGGKEVSEAAARSTVTPSPNSTSTNRRKRALGMLVSPAEASHLEEVHGAQGQETAEEGDLGGHHQPVGRPRHRRQRVDVGDAEARSADHEGGDGGQGEGREARKQEAGHVVTAGERGDDQVKEAPDPHEGRHLMERVQEEQGKAPLDASRGVAGARREQAEGERENCEAHRPPRAGGLASRRTAAVITLSTATMRARLTWKKRVSLASPGARGPRRPGW